MSSIPVLYSKSNGVLSCVSIITQSCAIDKVYLVSRLQNALWNCHFLSELLFLSLCFLNVLTYNLSQELLFQKMQFFRTANFRQTLEHLGHWVMHYSENVSIKYNDQNFTIKAAFSEKHWTEQTIDEFEKFLFLGNLIKISVSVLNFSTESAKKPTI